MELWDTSKSREEVIKRVCELIEEHWAAGNVVETTSVRDDLKPDSLDVVQLTMAVEEEFDVRIEDRELTKMTTPGAIADIVIPLLPRAPYIVYWREGQPS